MLVSVAVHLFGRDERPNCTLNVVFLVCIVCGALEPCLVSLQPRHSWTVYVGWRNHTPYINVQDVAPPLKQYGCVSAQLQTNAPQHTHQKGYCLEKNISPTKESGTGRGPTHGCSSRLVRSARWQPILFFNQPLPLNYAIATVR